MPFIAGCSAFRWAKNNALVLKVIPQFWQVHPSSFIFPLPIYKLVHFSKEPDWLFSDTENRTQIGGFSDRSLDHVGHVTIKLNKWFLKYCCRCFLIICPRWFTYGASGSKLLVSQDRILFYFSCSLGWKVLLSHRNQPDLGTEDLNFALKFIRLARLTKHTRAQWIK